MAGQEEFLSGVVLYRKPYRRYSDRWDHDHCEFCWAKFMEEGAGLPAGVLNEGYATGGGYYWVCPACFRDFRDQFAWEVVEADPPA